MARYYAKALPVTVLLMVLCLVSWRRRSESVTREEYAIAARQYYGGKVYVDPNGPIEDLSAIGTRLVLGGLFFGFVSLILAGCVIMDCCLGPYHEKDA